MAAHLSLTDDTFSDRFEYFGLRTVYDLYLLRDPIPRSIIETPQHFFLRIACGLTVTPHEAIEFYRLIASLDYIPSSPTLFNAGTKHPPMSSWLPPRLSAGLPRQNLRHLLERRSALQFSGGIGLARGTNWVFRDESCHLEFAFEVVNVVHAQEPKLWDADLEALFVTMLREAVDYEAQSAEDLLADGVAGLSLRDMRQYLGFVADSRLQRLGIAPAFHAKNPFSFMNLQDVQELTNFFERRVSAYQTAVPGEVGFGHEF